MIIRGDSLEELKKLDENSVDAVVTDPPYGLSFMGKKWDYDVPNCLLWKEVVRVLKPGGHLLSFGGARTYHRLVCAIEDAGFEVRDQIQWIYGSGFPKSLCISKAIDKSAGAEREVIGKSENARPGHRSGGAGFNQLGDSDRPITIQITAPSTPDAIKWQGWGTALKPANEPIVLARKPLSESTVAKNVLRWGVGALNIDGTRIASADPVWSVPESDKISDSLMVFDKPGAGSDSMFKNKGGRSGSTQGRWPANVLFDEEAAAMLDEQSGYIKSGKPGIKRGGNTGAAYGAESRAAGTQMSGFGDSGGASRFFYVAKASKRERGEGNSHPTVKPIKLMEYLCKLITPPQGTILDPFCGSGSTGVAAVRLGFKFIGIEREEEYCEIAKRRIEHATQDEQLSL